MSAQVTAKYFEESGTELKCCPKCGNGAYLEDKNTNECYCNVCGRIHDFKPNEGKIKVIFT